jgi:hypothetical protein
MPAAVAAAAPAPGCPVTGMSLSGRPTGVRTGEAGGKMAGSSKDVVSARRALERARGDLETKLAAEPAWAALVQLEARMERGEPSPGIDYEELRSRLVQRLDAKVADWRTMAAIEAAIAALDTAAAQDRDARAGPPQLPERGPSAVAPPPLPADRQSSPQAPARTRYGPATSRPRSPRNDMPGPSGPPLRAQPPALPREQRLQREPDRAEPRRTASAGHRIASALGLAGDGPARLTAIEAEIERMMRRDVGTWDNRDVIAPPVPSHASASAAPAPSPSARGTPDRRPYPTPASAGPVLHGEEAEVEIVALGRSPARAEPRPVSRLADRLSRVDPPTDGETGDAIPIMEAVEEAEVEIVLLEEAGQAQADVSADKRPPTGTR